jgi:hypothetical protein
MTKHWTDKLNKEEIQHLMDTKVFSITDMQQVRNDQRKLMSSVPGSHEPCWECRIIAKKLGLEK